MPRYVVLRHETPPGADRGLHWDLMLEAGDSLRTWALIEEPRAGASIDAEQLADHRLVYLEYEGPVSGNRGTVAQWTRGSYVLTEEAEGKLAVHFQTGGLTGSGTLQRSGADDQRWSFKWTGT